MTNLQSTPFWHYIQLRSCGLSTYAQGAWVHKMHVTASDFKIYHNAILSHREQKIRPTQSKTEIGCRVEWVYILVSSISKVTFFVCHMSIFHELHFVGVQNPNITSFYLAFQYSIIARQRYVRLKLIYFYIITLLSGICEEIILK